MKIYLKKNTITTKDKEIIRSILPFKFDRTMQIKNENERNLSLCGSLLLIKTKTVKKEADLFFGPEGKPYLKEGPYFSISHSGEYALLCVSDNICGADIQKPVVCSNVTEERVLNEKEYALLKSSAGHSFNCFWSIKESVVKAEGNGIKSFMKEIDTIPAFSGLPVYYRTRNYTISYFDFNGYAVSAASINAEEKFKFPGDEIILFE